ncbi:hypothetical protein BLNAU_17509 [Blattamonas nauphoetae]|uniref:Secreted protein n=1 Tax=Blattamonas nauphoetae TaxID=2049346 RepID=A0ABQ9X6X9_9EUKA|nr:hypothetical protein BLNAU_17509 [Blattamonas nauphoetae]
MWGFFSSVLITVSRSGEGWSWRDDCDLQCSGGNSWIRGNEGSLSDIIRQLETSRFCVHFDNLLRPELFSLIRQPEIRSSPSESVSKCGIIGESFFSLHYRIRFDWTDRLLALLFCPC